MKRKFTNIAQTITKHRVVSKISQAKLAGEIGFKHPQQISSLERGLQSLPHHAIHKTARALKMDSNIIVTAILADEEVHIKSIITNNILVEMKNSEHMSER